MSESNTYFNLAAEERNGYLVSSEMKRIWAVELDLLAKFIDICEKHNLTYFADGGTILGAVRHGGFIPWDNDIDVAMPRPDYEKFLSLGNSVFEQPYFLQTPQTENGRYFSTWSKLCNSSTTGRCIDDFNMGINCGIFIDIFPLDKIPENKFSRKLFYFRLDCIKKASKFCFGIAPKKGMINHIKFLSKKIYYNLILHSPDAATLFRMYNKRAASCWRSRSSLIGDVSFGYVDRFIWQYTEWEKPKKVAFEYLSINIPEDYDAVLSKQYGDYMTFPKDKSTHSYYTFNPDIPYSALFSKTNK